MPAPLPVPTTDIAPLTTALYAAVGLWVLKQAGEWVSKLVTWSAGRMVGQEDAVKADLKAKVEKLEKAVSELDRRVEFIDRDVKGAVAAADGVKGALGQMSNAVDVRIDKQGDFYRAEVKRVLEETNKQLEDLEFHLRQDTSRAMHDAASLAKKR